MCFLVLLGAFWGWPRPAPCVRCRSCKGDICTRGKSPPEVYMNLRLAGKKSQKGGKGSQEMGRHGALCKKNLHSSGGLQTKASACRHTRRWKQRQLTIIKTTITPTTYNKQKQQAADPPEVFMAFSPLPFPSSRLHKAPPPLALGAAA